LQPVRPIFSLLILFQRLIFPSVFPAKLAGRIWFSGRPGEGAQQGGVAAVGRPSGGPHDSVIVLVGRLEEQKADDVWAVVQGRGGEKYPDNVRVVVKFNALLAHHIIMAGCFEPCGLIEVQGMRYDTVMILIPCLLCRGSYSNNERRPHDVGSLHCCVQPGACDSTGGLFSLSPCSSFDLMHISELIFSLVFPGQSRVARRRLEEGCDHPKAHHQVRPHAGLQWDRWSGTAWHMISHGR
jgi:hypothetical protein